MELCPKCKKVRAERDVFTRRLVCYNRFCEIESSEVAKSNPKKASEPKKSTVAVKT